MMQQSKMGISLIEVLISIAISSLLGIGLLTSLNQTNRVATIIDRLVTTDERMALVRYQLDRDLAGAFIPTQAVPQKKQEKPQELAATPAQPGTPKQATPQKEEKEVKPLEKIFYATQKGDQIELLSFITNNPLQAYDKPRPCVTRVVYRLRESKSNKGAYTLMRQESANLAFEAFKEDAPPGVRGYELVDDIKSLSMKFFVKEEPKEKEKKAEQPKPGEQAKKPASNDPQPITYKLVNDWDLKKMLEESKEKKTKLMQQLPSFIQVTIVLWEGNPRKERPITFTISLLADIARCPVPLGKQQDVAAAKPVPKPDQPETPTLPAPPASAGGSGAKNRPGTLNFGPPNSFTRTMQNNNSGGRGIR